MLGCAYSCTAPMFINTYNINEHINFLICLICNTSLDPTGSRTSRGVVVLNSAKGNERGAMGSKNPPAYQNPCFSCSAWF